MSSSRMGRLIGILDILKSRAWISAQDLSEMFSVSSRTIYRDVADLQDYGVSIRATLGRDGGYQLDDESPFPHALFSNQDAMTLFLLNGGFDSDERAGSPTADQRSSLAARVGTEVTDYLETAGQRVFFDTSEWYWRDEGTSLLPVLREALFSARDLEVSLVERQGGAPRAARVSPLGLVWKGGEWYLIAQDEEGGRFRCRLARITSASVTSKGFGYPADFELKRWWTQELEGFGKGDLPIRLRVRPGAQGDFRRLALKTESLVESDGEDAIYTLFVDEWRWLVPLVLSHSPNVIVIGPELLRVAVAESLMESLALHGAVGAGGSPSPPSRASGDDSARRATRGATALRSD